jgi:hypothetical protein
MGNIDYFSGSLRNTLISPIQPSTNRILCGNPAEMDTA